MKTTASNKQHKCTQTGMVLIEATAAMAFAVFLALLIMRSSLLALSGNQWTIMQTLTDAYMTRETALSNRVLMADLTAPVSAWPDLRRDTPANSTQTVSLGTLAGGRDVEGQLTRFRLEETQVDNPDTNIAVWRMYSVLTYTVAGQVYVKTRSTLRTL